MTTPKQSEPAVLADEIEGYFAEASNNPCTCRHDELGCPHCNAWAQARRDTEQCLREDLRAPLTASEDVVEAIQGLIDNYSAAGANLLDWLTKRDRADMPKTKNPEWERWANDVACRAAFSALREAKDRVVAHRQEIRMNRSANRVAP